MFIKVVLKCRMHHDDIITWKYFLHYCLALCEGNPPATGGFPSQRASATKLFLWCQPEQTAEQTGDRQANWNVLAFILRYCIDPNRWTNLFIKICMPKFYNLVNAFRETIYSKWLSILVRKISALHFVAGREAVVKSAKPLSYYLGT